MDRFDVEQDRVRVRVARQMVDEVAEIDVGAVADRDELREADAARFRPVEHRGDQRPRLRDERDAARQRVDVRKARIQPDARNEQPDAVRPEDAQQMRSGRREHRFLQRRRAVRRSRAEPGADHDRRLRAAGAELGDDRRHRRGRRADDGELWRHR